MPINAGRTWLNRFGPRAQQVPFQPNPSLPYLIGSFQGNTVNPALVISVQYPTSPGDTIAVGASTGGGATVASVTDSQGNNYRQVVTSGINSSNNSSYLWITTNTRPRALGFTDTITVTFTSGQGGQYAYALDCKNYNAVDQTAGAFASTGTQATATTGTVTTPPELAVACVIQGSTGGIPTWITNWVQQKTFFPFAGARGSFAFNQINTPGTVTATTAVGSVNWSMSVMTLQQTQQNYPQYAQPGQAWIRRFATANHQLQIFVNAPPDSGSLVGTPANPGQTWRRLFTTITRQTISSRQISSPPSPPVSAGTSFVTPANPGKTWSRRFNLPEHITQLGRQTGSPPGPVTSAGTSYSTPIRPGQTWAKLFNFPKHITQLGNQVGSPTTVTPAGTPYMTIANPGRTWAIRFGERVRLIGTQQTIAPPPPSSSTGSRIPSPIQPGQTWSRRFKRITQQYVYSQVTPPPGVSFARPIQPGQMWLIRFRPRAQQYLLNSANVFIPGVTGSVLVSAPAGIASDITTGSVNVSVQAIPGGVGVVGLTGVTATVTVASTGTVTITKISDVPTVSVQAFAQLAGPFITATGNVSVAANAGSFTPNLVGPVTSVNVVAIPGSLLISTSATGATSVAAIAGTVTLGMSATAQATVAAFAGTTSWTKTVPTVNVNATAIAGQSGFLQISGPVSTVSVSAIAGSIQVFATATGNVSVIAPIGLAGGATINTQMFPSQFVGSVEPETSGWSGFIQVLPPPEINS